MKNLEEFDISFIAASTEIEGKITLGPMTRFFGKIKGEIRTEPNSELTIGETAVIEGKIFADRVFINGFVDGEVHATEKVLLGNSARVKGIIKAPDFQIETGAWFEGKATVGSATEATSNPES